MSGYYLFLMKVTHLNGNISKDASDSRSAIRYNRCYFEALAFNLSSGTIVRFYSFIINFSPEDILFDFIGPKDQDAILTAKVSGISHNDRFTRRNTSRWEFVAL